MADIVLSWIENMITIDIFIPYKSCSKALRQMACCICTVNNLILLLFHDIVDKLNFADGNSIILFNHSQL